MTIYSFKKNYFCNMLMCFSNIQNFSKHRYANYKLALIGMQSLTETTEILLTKYDVFVFSLKSYLKSANTRG